jgi:hypothetical protein
VHPVGFYCTNILIKFAGLPCEQDTLQIRTIFISRLSGMTQTLLSVKSECISRWSSDYCVELIKQKHPLSRMGLREFLWPRRSAGLRQIIM